MVEARAVIKRNLVHQNLLCSLTRMLLYKRWSRIWKGLHSLHIIGDKFNRKTNMDVKLSLVLACLVFILGMAQSQDQFYNQDSAEVNRANKNPFSLYFGRMLLKRNEDLFSDPRFLHCIKELDVQKDPLSAMPMYAKCVSFVGRPRFGKRNNGWDLSNY